MASDLATCARCRNAPRLGGGVYCPWCQYGPQPPLWPPSVRHTVELQGGFNLAPGALPSPTMACNPGERRMQDGANPFGYTAQERVLRNADRSYDADRVVERAERAYATPGPWELR